MKLSIIVPVYNVEKYLPRCLDSLLCQGMRIGEWEVICVNDGSTDNCAEILSEYAQKDPEIFKIISQENRGLGEARNKGLRMAQGEWITFVDSDDYIVDGGYKYLLDHFCKEDYDVVAFENYYVHTDGVERKYSDVPLTGTILYEGDGVEGHNRFEMPHVWSKFYRRMFLQEYGVVFTSVYFEDLLFNFQLFRCEPHLIYVDSKVYGYERDNVNSLMHRTQRQIVLAQLDGLLYCTEYMNNYLRKGNKEMEPAALRCIRICMDHFYRKAFRIHLTWKEWRNLTVRLQKLPIHQTTPVYASNKAYKRVAMMKNLSGSSYVVYALVSSLYRKFLYKAG
jgi:glycosyltransferase involved in cell wall biosynthesis